MSDDNRQRIEQLNQEIKDLKDAIKKKKEKKDDTSLTDYVNEK